MKDCFLLGWHGTINIGDDLMAILYINENKKEYKKIYSFNKMYTVSGTIGLSKFKGFLKMLSSDDLVISGGNIFLISSKKSYIKLSVFYFIFFIRKLFAKPTYIDSIGLDLNIGKTNRFILLKIISLVTSISVREPLSYRYLKKQYIDSSLNYDRVYRYKEILQKKYQLDNKNKNILWFISGQPAKKNKFEKAKTEIFLKYLNEKYSLNEFKIIFFCQNKDDIDRVEELLMKYPYLKNSKMEFYEYLKLEAQMKIIASCSFTVVERYHGAILSEALKLNWYKLAFSEKLERAYLPNHYCLNCEVNKK